jgi:hypothetical protein
LAELLLHGHPGDDGNLRLQISAPEIRRLLAWIDLNVPYYGTSETAYPERKGCCQIYRADLDPTLLDVGKRRCAECHKGGQIPRQFWTRIFNPQMNNFLLAPLAQSAGGSGICGQPVFASTDDPDYQAILKKFQAVNDMLRERPRMDMPGGKPAVVDRSCLGKLD